MTPIPRELLHDRAAVDRERGRRSFARFVRLAWPVVEPQPLRWSWHLDALCEHLQAVSAGEIRDLVVCQPPGTSKSLVVSTLWPAWDWIGTPARRILAATYAQDLSEKNARLHRDLVLSDWYQERWGDLVQIRHEDSAKVREFQNDRKGVRWSTSVGGVATGRHADVLLGDDLVKAQDAEGRAYVDPVMIQKANDFWEKTMATRRADAATTRRVMIAQRLHHDDTPGRCIERGYTALVLPMEHDPGRRCRTVVYWRGEGGTGPRRRFEDPRTEKGDLLVPSRFPRDVVEADKITLGSLTYEAQNQQNPTPHEGAIWKVEKLRRWTTLPPNLNPIITVDCSFKETKTSDFVSIQVWAASGPDFFMLPWRYCDRAGLFKTIEAILRAREAYPRASVIIEDKANGPAVAEVLRGQIPGVIEWTPTGSKESRAHATAPLVEAGNVYIPPDSEAPWIGEVTSVWGRFPLVKNDDDMDSATMALLNLYKPRVSRYADAIRILAGRNP